MSIKHFCDACGEPYTPEPGLPIEAKIKVQGTVTATITVQKRGESDICRRCIFDAVASLDNRSQVPEYHPLSSRINGAAA